MEKLYITMCNEKSKNFKVELTIAWMQIIGRSSKTSTLKYALGRSLLDIARDNKGSLKSIVLTKESIADKFIEYYWYQVLKFRLKQSGDETTKPNVVKILETKLEVNSKEKNEGNESQDTTTSKVFSSSPLKLVSKELLATLREELSSSSFNEVLPKFHRIRGGGDTEIKFFNITKTGIEIEPEIIEFLNEFRLTLLSSLLHHWTLLLERYNTSPKIAGKLTYDGNRKRKSSASYLNVLKSENGSKCFFCNEAIKGKPHVEHMLPHSYVFEDELWNLTLSCKDCNLEKSDFIPCKLWLEKLFLRNKEILESNTHPAQKMLKKSLRNISNSSILTGEDAIFLIRENALSDGFSPLNELFPTNKN